MNRTITDAGVAGLAVREGRAELLEEIMTLTPVETPDPIAPSPLRRIVPVLVAVAAVAAVVAGTAWLGRQGDDGSAVTATPGRGSGELAVLEAPGWVLTYARVDDHGGDLVYRSGDEADLEINWRPADAYAGYVTDREDIGVSEDVEVLGAPARLWAYADDDHTVIREVVGEHTIEARGTGLSKSAYLGLLDRLTPLDPADARDHLPAKAFADAGYEAPGSYRPLIPERPALIRDPGWSLGMEDHQYFYERGRAQVLMSPVGGVEDPFVYDRYLEADVREEITVLGERSLLAEWKEADGTQYRVAAVPATSTSALIFEGTGLTRKEFLEVVASAEWVSPEEYAAAVTGQG
ncbi:hypothetical protein [Nocardioides sp. L-11A]|uniref:hypothetical protein n=1 Tax=Nocardioides sp. L-11A TaxID=3043848 RepID=UPI002499F5C8|nr:hypothetical protein QJ852_04030 [Nocardioides sp. L-11A]